MPRKTKETPSVEQLIEPVQEMTIEKPKRTRKTKIAEPAPAPVPAPAPIEQKKRAPSKWVQALKQYNTGRSGYIIPKKDTPEYSEIRALMDKM